MVKQEARTPTISQHNSYNCGIIDLVHAIEMYCESAKFHKLKTA